MKKIWLLMYLLLISSCSYINEEQVIEKDNVDIDTFLWTSNLEENISIEDIEIKYDDILFDENNILEETTEEDINELIDILFETN